jgi:hypothetical protein
VTQFALGPSISVEQLKLAKKKLQEQSVPDGLEMYLPQNPREREHYLSLLNDLIAEIEP